MGTFQGELGGKTDLFILSVVAAVSNGVLYSAPDIYPLK